MTAGARTFFSNLTGTRNLTHTGDELLLPENLQGVSFQGVRVNKAVAEQIVKNNGSLAGAILVGDFTNADLTRAVLTEAILTDTFLAGADLRDADLTYADFTGAYHVDPDDPTERIPVTEAWLTSQGALVD